MSIQVQQHLKFVLRVQILQEDVGNVENWKKYQNNKDIIIYNKNITRRFSKWLVYFKIHTINISFPTD